MSRTKLCSVKVRENHVTDTKPDRSPWKRALERRNIDFYLGLASLVRLLSLYIVNDRENKQQF